MHNVVLGLNHHTAEVSIREKCHFPDENLEEALSQVIQYPSIHGAVILSTCNRVEIYASVSSVKQGLYELSEFMSAYHHIPKEKLQPHLYQKECHQTVIHLFKVAAGIDSMVVGEYQIQGQVRDAYFKAYSLHYTDAFINKLFQSAINSGKRVRTETEIGKGSTSVAHMVVELMKKVFVNKKKFEVLMVGAGKMAQLAAANLNECFDVHLTVANRTKAKAEQLAFQYEGAEVEYVQRYEAMKHAQVIVVTTGANSFTVEAREVSEMMKQHPMRSKLFIDLSIPRNVDPAINQIENCMVYSIDDINQLIDVNVSKRKQEIHKAESILEEVSEDFYNWYYKQIIMPTMQSIKGRLEGLKTKSIEAYKDDFERFSPDQQAIMEKILDVYSDSFIKLIMNNLKSATSKEEMIRIVETLKNSFSVGIEIPSQGE